MSYAYFDSNSFLHRMFSYIDKLIFKSASWSELYSEAVLPAGQ